MSISAIALFCGSKTGVNNCYKEDAEALGLLLARHKIELIYGGGKNGLMGCVADAALLGGGTVRGIITEQLGDWEVGHPSLHELTIVDTMHERKRLMYERCDAAIILPGGFGTLDELFELLTWNQLLLHQKTVFILNSGGFYNHLLQYLVHLSKEGFLYGNLEAQFTVLHSPAELSNYL